MFVGSTKINAILFIADIAVEKEAKLEKRKTKIGERQRIWGDGDGDGFAPIVDVCCSFSCIFFFRICARPRDSDELTQKINIVRFIEFRVRANRLRILSAMR